RLRPANGRILVALSGGPDSSALTDALVALAPELGLHLFVATVDHGLRPESRAEAAEAVARARALRPGAPLLAGSPCRPVPESARHARYAALTEHAQSIGVGALAAAHTATDQVETLLDRMLRGGGLRGVSAMRWSRPIAPGIELVRPLLGVSREEV